MKYINEKAKKAMANIIKICAICKYLTVQSCTTLVLMLCITHLDYANAMLYGLPSNTLRKYQTIQNSCTKLILNKNRYSSSSWALKKLHWLPIQQRIEHKILDDSIQMHHWHGTKVLTGPNQLKKQHMGQYANLATLAPCYTHQSQVSNLCSMVLQVFCTNIMEPSYQNSSKIHQPWTSSRRG